MYGFTKDFKGKEEDATNHLKANSSQRELLQKDADKTVRSISVLLHALKATR